MGYSIYKRYIEFETLFQEQTQLIETLNSKIDLLDQKLNTILPKSEVHSERHSFTNLFKFLKSNSISTDSSSPINSSTSILFKMIPILAAILTFLIR